MAIVTKKDRAESNTNYAQGGIASVTSKEDSFELHVRDTLTAGAGLCKESVVRTIVEEGPAQNSGVDRAGHEIFRAQTHQPKTAARNSISGAKAAIPKGGFCTRRT